MAVDTATIRVTRETRDLLAQQARDRGMSLASMLTELARDVTREAVFRSERQAARADAGSRGAPRGARVGVRSGRWRRLSRVRLWLLGG